ncbi:type II toxin-antitoxin system RelE/ParE family toxin [Candidatus Poriferisodalis sp.]|uniref:type II toxin-antitoxin system RelE/ParE family toxin n=1 Tax=Candidatus Poriferisodalis sp. TaxID=3101277 RepID=UPI003C6F5D5B
MAKAVELNAAAARDIGFAVDYYAIEAGASVAHRFISELDQAFDYLSSHPLSGSTRWAHELGIPELRSWSLQRFPYVVFYVDRPSFSDVWRVLHARRDLPASLAPSGGGR